MSVYNTNKQELLVRNYGPHVLIAQHENVLDSF